MTLHFTLHVNGKAIDEGMTIQRTTQGSSSPVDVNPYVVQAKCGGVWYTVTVQHRQCDGPWVLVLKALNAIAAEEVPHA